MLSLRNLSLITGRGGLQYHPRFTLILSREMDVRESCHRHVMSLNVLLSNHRKAQRLILPISESSEENLRIVDLDH